MNKSIIATTVILSSVVATFTPAHADDVKVSINNARLRIFRSIHDV